jgi:hypothetical protein
MGQVSGDLQAVVGEYWYESASRIMSAKETHDVFSLFLSHIPCASLFF